MSIVWDGITDIAKRLRQLRGEDPTGRRFSAMEPGVRPVDKGPGLADPQPGAVISGGVALSINDYEKVAYDQYEKAFGDRSLYAVTDADSGIRVWPKPDDASAPSRPERFAQALRYLGLKLTDDQAAFARQEAERLEHLPIHSFRRPPAGHDTEFTTGPLPGREVRVRLPEGFTAYGSKGK